MARKKTPSNQLELLTHVQTTHEAKATPTRPKKASSPKSGAKTTRKAAPKAPKKPKTRTRPDLPAERTYKTKKGRTYRVTRIEY